MNVFDRIALALTVIGALNWGSVGLFSFDFVGWLAGGGSTPLARVIFSLVGVAGLWCISLIFRNVTENNRRIEAR